MAIDKMDERWQEIERIYHAALEREKNARPAFVAKACAGDESLRREVEFLLAQDEQAGNFLESPAIKVVAEFLAEDEHLLDPAKPSIEIGTMVAHYRLIAKVGEGGMGEVYRARDTKLQRDVALKILPQALARDRERMARFEREAQVLASLNHPNIAAIYGLEESNGIRALAMELVEGATLAERIALAEVHSPPARSGEFTSPHGGVKPPLQLGELLPIARQIAEALEYAHERGVIHRDLKPANVKITPEGTVKVLDFGLAKAVAPGFSPAHSDATKDPTVTTLATQPGMILGTAAYMSPEQARGQRADRRCDIWAFGCVLYEMLSGRKTFDGETISDVLAAVITKEPDWNALPGTTPLSIQKLIRRCLQKDVRQRLQAIGDARIAVEETLSGADEAPPLSPLLAEEGKREARSRGGFRRALTLAVGGCLLAIAAVFAGLYFRLAKAPTRAIVAEIPAPSKASFVITSLNGATPVLSPDGGRLAFVAIGPDGRQALWVRSLDSTEAQPLEGTERAIAPFWSPDGRHLGFFAGGKLKKIGLSGGAPVEVCDARWGRGATWGADGTILFAPNVASPIYRVSEGGGTPAAVTTLDPSRLETGQRWPQFLPDGHHFIFYAVSSSGKYDGTYVASPGGGGAKLILSGSSNAVYAAGHLLFRQGANLMARRFDLNDLQLIGESQAIAGNPGVLDVAHRSLVAASEDGVLAYSTVSPAPTDFQLQWFDRSGKQAGSVRSSGALNLMPRLSPDGKRLATAVPTPGNFDVWVYNLTRGIPMRLTFSHALNVTPVWSPDGRAIAFASNHGGLSQIYEKSADSTGAETPLLRDDADDSPSSWSPDGKYLALNRQTAQGKSSVGIWILPMFGERKPFPFLTSQFNERDATFSADGKWLAYTSDESGRDEIYIAPFPKGNGKWEVSTGGGSVPRWRHDGKELYYLAPDANLMAVDIVEKSGSIESGSPQALFQTNTDLLVGRPYDVTDDGKKFLVLAYRTQNSAVPITIIFNWPALLKKQ